MTLGNVLKETREKKGLSTSQVAASTHILVQIIQGLENEDFSRIPAPIYGRGFVKTYAELLELDPAPLQAAFTDLWNHPEKRGMNIPKVQEPVTNEAPIDETPIPPVDETPIPPVMENSPIHSELEGSTEKVTSNTQLNTHQLPSGDYDLFNQPPPSMADDLPPPATVANPPIPTTEPLSQPQDITPQAAAPAPRRATASAFANWEAPEDSTDKQYSAATRFRNTLSNVSHGVLSNVHHLPHNFGRIILLVCLAIVLVALSVWAIIYLYRATATKPVPEASKPEVTVSATTKNHVTKNNPLPQDVKKVAENTSAKATNKTIHSTGVNVPPLYID